LLDELVRLGMAHVDLHADTVSLLQQGFVPKGDWQRMLAFLRDNVSDHLNAAVTNVLSDKSPHFEQAVFADNLSRESVEMVRNLARQHWKQLLSEAVSLLEQRIAVDRDSGVDAGQRVRLGLFTYHDAMADDKDKDPS